MELTANDFAKSGRGRDGTEITFVGNNGAPFDTCSFFKVEDLQEVCNLVSQYRKMHAKRCGFERVTRKATYPRPYKMFFLLNSENSQVKQLCKFAYASSVDVIDLPLI